MIKKHLLLIISRALVGACQHKAPSAKEQPRVAATALTPAHAAAATPMPSLFTAADTLTRPMRQLLSRYDLSKLWQGDTEERRTNPTMEGFFGPDHYRFALVFNEVKRDEQHPEVYHVRGKCRYRKNIRLFSGFLTVQTVKDLA